MSKSSLADTQMFPLRTSGFGQLSSLRGYSEHSDLSREKKQQSALLASQIIPTLLFAQSLLLTWLSKLA